MYAVAGAAADLARNDGKLVAKKYGIRAFSTLNCFCSKHDKNLFAPIEDRPLTFSGQQLLLLQYRTLASELYRKVTSYHSILQQIKDRSKSPKRNAFALRFLRNHAVRTLAGLRDVGESFEACANSLSEGTCDTVSALVVHFNKRPSIMTVGGFMAQFDYTGHRIQDVRDIEKPAELVCFNILSVAERAVVIVLWSRSHSASGKAFADSYASQKPSLLSALAIQTAFEYLENTCFNIPWWDLQKPVIREVLLGRMQSSANLMEPRQSSCLTFGGVNFDDWDYARHEYINVD